ncbi:hypothetical protein NDU88_002463 [Pleurodeles waltl]|uniref:Uncharacterized protein n=1 Tax=Pleurodeles waltl TaxID=8319 RepID=A0AAV7SF85_PLEWA|nr:hypothetical protein NDU88_002463 [Pleurodeles waltl]
MGAAHMSLMRIPSNPSPPPAAGPVPHILLESPRPTRRRKTERNGCRGTERALPPGVCGPPDGQWSSTDLGFSPAALKVRRVHVDRTPCCEYAQARPAEPEINTFPGYCERRVNIKIEDGLESFVTNRSRREASCTS